MLQDSATAMTRGVEAGLKEAVVTCLQNPADMHKMQTTLKLLGLDVAGRVLLDIVEEGIFDENDIECFKIAQ